MYAEFVRTSWKEWVIRVALVGIAIGGVWILWGDEISRLVNPPVVAPPATSGEARTL